MAASKTHGAPCISPKERRSKAWIGASVTIVISAGGDALITRAAFEGTRELARDTFQTSDVGFCNLEMVVPAKPWTPASTIQGFALAARPRVLDELRALGMNLISVANNHATDYAPAGLVDTLDELAARDLAYAGAGRTLADARRPAWLRTDRGAVALVAAASSNARLAAAADPGVADIGRPGINPLRFRTRYVLSLERFEALASSVEGLGLTRTTAGVPFPGVHLAYPDRGLFEATREEGSIWIEGIEFVEGTVDTIETTCDPRDLGALCEVVEEVAGTAAAVVVSLHCHEGPLGTWNNERPAAFIVEAAHAVVDAGAHVVFGHGPHTVRGIQVREGRPIFYSLGNLFFELDTLEGLPLQVLEQQGLQRDSSALDFLRHVSPQDAEGQRGGIVGKRDLWDSVVARCSLDQGSWTEIRLDPIVLQDWSDESYPGSPRLADRDEAAAVLGRIVELSAELGTQIKIGDTEAGLSARVQF
jgi:poly-gamma-glutamate capsule biosynthesis protein CapA/YwtB (metallophosphatase superfamily)